MLGLLKNLHIRLILFPALNTIFLIDPPIWQITRDKMTLAHFQGKNFNTPVFGYQHEGKASK